MNQIAENQSEDLELAEILKLLAESKAEDAAKPKGDGFRTDLVPFERLRNGAPSNLLELFQLASNQMFRKDASTIFDDVRKQATRKTNEYTNIMRAISKFRSREKWEAELNKIIKDDARLKEAGQFLGKGGHGGNSAQTVVHGIVSRIASTIKEHPYLQADDILPFLENEKEKTLKQTLSDTGEARSYYDNLMISALIDAVKSNVEELHKKYGKKLEQTSAPVMAAEATRPTLEEVINASVEKASSLLEGMNEEVSEVKEVLIKILRPAMAATKPKHNLLAITIAQDICFYETLMAEPYVTAGRKPNAPSAVTVEKCNLFIKSLRLISDKIGQQFVYLVERYADEIRIGMRKVAEEDYHAQKEHPPEAIAGLTGKARGHVEQLEFMDESFQAAIRDVTSSMPTEKVRAA